MKIYKLTVEGIAEATYFTASYDATKTYVVTYSKIDPGSRPSFCIEVIEILERWTHL